MPRDLWTTMRKGTSVPPITITVESSLKDETLPIHALFNNKVGQAEYSVTAPAIRIYDSTTAQLVAQGSMSKEVHTIGLYTYKIKMASPFIEGNFYIVMISGTIGSLSVKGSASFRYEDRKKLNYIYQKEATNAKVSS